MKKVLFAALLMAGTFVYAQTVEEILKTFTDNDRVPDHNYTLLSLENIDANGKVEKLECLQYGGGDNDLKNVMFDFRAPATMKGTRVLQAQKKGKDDDRWIYMPELRSTRRIPSSEKKKAFVGTEFIYDDLNLREPNEDVSVFVSENQKWSNGLQTFDCWVIKSTPIKKGEVNYSYRISYFDKKTYVPVYVEFYDIKDRLLKTHTCNKLEMVKGETGIEYPLRRLNTIENKLTKRKTTCTVVNYKFDKEVPSSYFTQNYLVTGKAK